MCDVGETRILANGVSPASLLAAAKLRRPSCDEQQDKAAPGTPSPSRSTPSTPTSLRRASSLEKCFSDPEFFKKQRQLQRSRLNGCPGSPARGDGQHPRRSPSSSRGGSNGEKQPCSEPTAAAPENGNQCNGRLADAEEVDHEVITNGASKSSREDCDVCDGPTNGKDVMAPVLGVPPPPPPAPHMGPDGLILPRKPYNPCMGSNSHKDLHRELLFNQKIGKNVLNQKSELQRALEKHREMVSRKEAERVQEESYKSDPRTALQRAIEQRAKHIQLVQQPQQTEPPNPLVTARAKLRSRMDSQ